MTRITAVAAFSVAIFASSQVDAQAWLSDRARREGPGFRVGNLEIHPGVGAEFGYDSNIFLRDQDVISSLILRISPHIDISTLGEQRREDGGADREGSPPVVQFRAGLSGALYIFFANQARNDVALNADIALTVLPDRPFSFTIYDQFTRRIRPFTDQGGLSGNNFARDENIAGVDFNFQSRGGVFSAGVGYGFYFNMFEGDSFNYANRFEHRIKQRTSFKFLPNTALFQESTLDYTTFPNDPVALNLVNNWRIRSRVGLNGAITSKVSLMVAVGYGGVYTPSPIANEFDSVIAQAELRIRPTATTKLSFGYERDFMGSLIGNWRTRDRGYLNFQLLVARSFLLGIDGWVGYLNFGNVVDSTGAPIGSDTARSDIMVSANLFAEYRFTDWLGLNASVGYVGDITDFQYNRMVGTAMMLDPANFHKFQAWIGLRAFY